MSRYLNSPREADWYACPTCGDEVRVGSAGCRECRALPMDLEDAREGVADVSEDLEDFNYEEWKKNEFGAAAKVKPSHLPWKYWLAGICLLAAMIWLAVFAGFTRH